MSELTLTEALRLTPEFDGNSSELHRFLNSCNTVIELLTTEQKVPYFKVLKLKLKGRAYELVKYTEFSNYEDLKKKLLSQFLETRTLETLQSDLINARQQNNESEIDFGNRVEQLLMDLNTACCPDSTVDKKLTEPIRILNSRTALKAFQEGLREPLRLLIKASRYSTLKEAIEAAACEGKNKNNRNESSQSRSHTNSKFCNHCRKNGHTFDECRSKLKCTNCQRIGHSATQCRVKSNPENNHTATPTRHIHQTSLVCRYCKKSGHHIKDCRKRIYNNNRVNSNPNNSENSNSPTEHRAPVAAIATA